MFLCVLKSKNHEHGESRTKGAGKFRTKRDHVRRDVISECPLRCRKIIVTTIGQPPMSTKHSKIHLHTLTPSTSVIERTFGVPSVFKTLGTYL